MSGLRCPSADASQAYLFFITLTGHGDGSFTRTRTFPADGIGIPGPSAIAVGLMNKDLKHDIVVAHFSGNLVSVLLNTCTKEYHHHE